MAQKKKNGWKVATLVLSGVCFFLFLALVIESIVLISFVVIQNELERMELECSTQVCGSGEYTSYLFDDVHQICQCYIGEDIALEQKIT